VVEIPGVFAAVSASASPPLDSKRRRQAMFDESKIRERAYALWEKDACPDGADHFYWYLARDQLEATLQPLHSELDGEGKEEKGSLVTGASTTVGEGP
jgi:hypothetical protein